MSAKAFALLPLLWLFPVPTTAQEPVDLDMVNRIRDEGFHRSQVMETVEYLADVVGPRLTGSPGSKEAQEWTRDRLAAWGLENARLEDFEFGEGWSFSRSAVHMLSPHQMPLRALPKAWTPGTKKAVQGKAIRLNLESEEDFEEHKGKLKGKILFLDDEAKAGEMENTPFKRHDVQSLDQRMIFDLPGEPSRWRQRMKKRYAFREALKRFLKEEGVVATVDASSRGNGVLRLGGGGNQGDPEREKGVLGLTMAQEHYNWVLRLLEREKEVELEIDVRSRYHDDDLRAWNTVADLPGSEHPEQIVLLGGHLDSWHAGSGATDNAAACAVMMEAMRILKAVGAEPKRTLRIGLWSGEEQGLLGARAYVERHLATRPYEENPELPERMWEPGWPIEPKAGHEHFSVYFNLDNGGGKIRGIYTQENVAVAPIFRAWLEPLHDLEADRVTHNRTGGTDHLAFGRVGLPGFQFIQDPMDYFSRTHHTQLDTLEHVVEDDLKQAAVVVATFAYHAAMRDELLPRKPMPRKPPERKEKEDEDDGPRGGGRGSSHRH